MKFQPKYKTFPSRKYIWNYRLQNDVCFVWPQCVKQTVVEVPRKIFITGELCPECQMNWLRQYESIHRDKNQPWCFRKHKGHNFNNLPKQILNLYQVVHPSYLAEWCLLMDHQEASLCQIWSGWIWFLIWVFLLSQPLHIWHSEASRRMDYISSCFFFNAQFLYW